MRRLFSGPSPGAHPPVIGSALAGGPEKRASGKSPAAPQFRAVLQMPEAARKKGAAKNAAPRAAASGSRLAHLASAHARSCCRRPDRPRSVARAGRLGLAGFMVAAACRRQFASLRAFAARSFVAGQAAMPPGSDLFGAAAPNPAEPKPSGRCRGPAQTIGAPRTLVGCAREISPAPSPPHARAQCSARPQQPNTP